MTFLALGDLHLHRRGIAKHGRLPLIGFATDEPIEVIETLQRWPAVERAGDAGFPVGNLMILTNVFRAVAVLTQDFRDHRSALGNLAGIARIGIREFRDNSHAYGMMIATGQERGTRR